MNIAFRLLTAVGIATLVFTGARGLVSADDGDDADLDAANHVSAENCTFTNDPDSFLERAARLRSDIVGRTDQARKSIVMAGSSNTVSPNLIPRRNQIDVEIFGRLATERMPSAAISSDAEFVRRIYLDLTGRLPDPSDIRAFLSNTSANKRNALIDKLLYTPEFVDKWTMWLGDLFQVTSAQTTANRQTTGRNVYNDWIKKSVQDSKPLNDMVFEGIMMSGNNYDQGSAAANFILNGRATMGPNQDIYDLSMYQATSRFLGLSHYDCLLCHDGRRHLDDLSLWAKAQTRANAERMAAFFSRVSITQPFQADTTAPYYNSFLITDRTTGNYTLNTNFGNRPNRVAIGAVTSLNPEYRDGTSPTTAFWRGDFAVKVANDPLLPVTIANRLWKAMYGYGLAEPVDYLDPDRLDADNPPAAPWELQPSHPRLLKYLAAELQRRKYDLRGFIKFLVESSAYQLSTRYDAPWDSTKVELFARHIPRRLDGEEVADAIAKATGVGQSYTIVGFPAPVLWAIQVPEPTEPRSNGAVNNFMNSFLRGNRDTTVRSQAGSIIQQLNLMNDNFVLSRIRYASSLPIRTAAGLANAQAADEMYLMFLSRFPTSAERTDAAAIMQGANTTALRQAAFEDLAWTLINKAEFIFSY
jgi:hypothetical protein